MKILETERLILRRLDAGDAPFVRQLVNEPAWLEYIGDRGVKTIEDSRRFIENGPVAMYQRHGFGSYLVELKATGEPVGICGPIKRETLPDIDLGFALLTKFHARGYAFESASAVLAYAKNQLGLSRIVAITAQGNVASVGLLEKLGFRFERMVRLVPDGPELKLHAIAL